MSRNSTRETVALVTRMAGRIMERIAAQVPGLGGRLECIPGVPRADDLAAARARGAALLSVVLVDVTRCGSPAEASIATPIMREAIPGRAGLRARYLVTPWTGDASSDALVIRGLERALDPMIVTGPEDLGPDAQDVECPPLVTRDLAFEREKMRGLWEILARPPQPSIVCAVSFDAAAEE